MMTTTHDSLFAHKAPQQNLWPWAAICLGLLGFTAAAAAALNILAA